MKKYLDLSLVLLSVLSICSCQKNPINEKFETTDLLKENISKLNGVKIKSITTIESTKDNSGTLMRLKNTYNFNSHEKYMTKPAYEKGKKDEQYYALFDDALYYYEYRPGCKCAYIPYIKKTVDTIDERLAFDQIQREKAIKLALLGNKSDDYLASMINMVKDPSYVINKYRISNCINHTIEINGYRDRKGSDELSNTLSIKYTFNKDLKPVKFYYEYVQPTEEKYFSSKTHTIDKNHRTYEKYEVTFKLGEIVKSISPSFIDADKIFYDKCIGGKLQSTYEHKDYDELYVGGTLNFYPKLPEKEKSFFWSNSKDFNITSVSDEEVIGFENGSWKILKEGVVDINVGNAFNPVMYTFKDVETVLKS